MSAELKPETIELANKLKKFIKLDPKSGLATIEEGVYVKHLPEGITEEQVKVISKYNAQLVASGALALGEMSIPLMKKHSELMETKLEIPMGNAGDKIELAFQRSKINSGFGAEKTEKFGNVTHGMTIRATRGGTGQLSAVKSMLFGMGAEHLSGKELTTA